MVVVPHFNALIVPFSTVATEESEELHEIALLVALFGVIVALRFSASPKFHLMVDLSRLIPVTGV